MDIIWIVGFLEISFFCLLTFLIKAYDSESCPSESQEVIVKKIVSP